MDGKGSYVDPAARGDAGFKELNILDKSSRDCLHYFAHINMEQLNKLLREARLIQNQSTFMLPYQFSKMTNYKKFKGVTEVKQLVIDLRTTAETHDDNEGISRETLVTDTNVFATQANIKASQL